MLLGPLQIRARWENTTVQTSPQARGSQIAHPLPCPLQCRDEIASHRQLFLASRVDRVFEAPLSPTPCPYRCAALLQLVLAPHRSSVSRLQHPALSMSLTLAFPPHILALCLSSPALSPLPTQQSGCRARMALAQACEYRASVRSCLSLGSLASSHHKKSFLDCFSRTQVPFTVDRKFRSEKQGLDRSSVRRAVSLSVCLPVHTMASCLPACCYSCQY
ncbi:hypothetical protein CCHR01_11097 [Colletotrichum chrysophilum]|uniref:Uncharacterized protein n=1 Tax=Colletotrichum chrysophilum TaxID=1836956 RepID=A0AAD9EFB8_9PEZI|nr:hypothetical protein CCHR01_11097 [Colletotrichum chrysophilum]